LVDWVDWVIGDLLLASCLLIFHMYPFFVYGTLIPGQVNDFYWGDCVEKTARAVFPGGRLYDMGSFPMLIEGGDKLVTGQVMYPRADLGVKAYKLLVQRLDSLENYDPNDMDTSPYYRVLRTVYEQDARPVNAWVYLGRPIFTDGRPLIPGGDWVKYSVELQSYISDWWRKQKQGLLFGENKRDGE
jgi:gamma-glutamylcyclotransferase (GGCT)/AIG2-like uncharacterized protein YtfP